jgi:hypothetical protein
MMEKTAPNITAAPVIAFIGVIEVPFLIVPRLARCACLGHD